MADRATSAARLDVQAIAYGVVLREDARLSPDGTRLAYTRHAPRADGSRQAQVVLVDGLGSRPVPRVVRRGASMARWSPDGGCLAFVRAARGEQRLVVHRPGSAVGAGTGATDDVGPAFASISEVEWAPDGTRLAVVGSAPGGAPSVDGLALVDVASGATSWLEVGGEAAGCAWAPDGRTIAVRVRHPDGYIAWLELLDASTGERTGTAGDADSRMLGATWTPDGRSLLVLGAPRFSFHPGLHRFDPASGRLDPVIDEPGPFVADLGGWLGPDRLLVHGHDRARSGLYVLSLAAGRLDLVADLAGRAWGLTIDAAGERYATVRESATEPPAVIVGDVATGAWSRVRDVGRSLGDLGPAARPETVTVQRGDTTLDAWVLAARGPSAAPAGRPGPAVLMVHGGPHDDLGDEWDVGVGQLLAGEGFVVGWSNPRGSISYGRAFADAAVGDLGGAELDDLVAVADALAARPDVDRSRIGICGYSHGGFLAASAVARTDRFAAAACWAPLTDLLSEWGMSDEGRGWGRRVVGVDPTRDPAHYRDRSPASHVTGPVAPTLLIHGERDQRCPVGQSALFHELLLATGTPTRLVRRPDTDHDLVGTPADLAVVASETLAWFDTHLRPAEATGR